MKYYVDLKRNAADQSPGTRADYPNPKIFNSQSILDPRALGLFFLAGGGGGGGGGGKGPILSHAQKRRAPGSMHQLQKPC